MNDYIDDTEENQEPEAPRPQPQAKKARGRKKVAVARKIKTIVIEAEADRLVTAAARAFNWPKATVLVVAVKLALADMDAAGFDPESEAAMAFFKAGLRKE